MQQIECWVHSQRADTVIVLPVSKIICAWLQIQIDSLVTDWCKLIYQ